MRLRGNRIRGPAVADPFTSNFPTGYPRSAPTLSDDVVSALPENVQKLPARRSCALLPGANEVRGSGSFFVTRA